MPFRRTFSSRFSSLAPLLRRLIAASLAVGLVLSFGGCGGCVKEDPITKAKREAEEKKKAEEEEKKKEKEKPKPNFDFTAIEVLPCPPVIIPLLSSSSGNNSPPPSSTQAERPPLVKTGHWATGSVSWRANNFDFPGDLQLFPGSSTNPLDVERTNFRISTSRPISLPKGQIKPLESMFFIPRRDPLAGSRVPLQMRLLASHQGATRWETSHAVKSMATHEYLFVVLAPSTASYEFLRKQGDSFPSMCIRDDNSLDGNLRFYHVQAPDVKKRIPLPQQALLWTSIAYLLIDDIDPSLFTTEQQLALADWLHWGGQILISGPKTLDRLRGTFLEKHLPATAGESIKLTDDKFAEINQNWGLKSEDRSKKDVTQIVMAADRPIPGVDLQLVAEATFVPLTGNLLAERRIGAGRIVVSSFPLNDFRIQNWRNYDGFFNGALLRHPARQFRTARSSSIPSRAQLYGGALNGTVEGPATFDWIADPEALLSASDLPRGERRFLGSPNTWPLREAEDPRVVSSVRYFSRDVGSLDNEPPQAPPPPARQFSDLANTGVNERQNRQFDDDYLKNDWASYQYSTEATKAKDWHFSGYEGAPESGVAGWNDFSGASTAARDSLREAAGIRIPQAGFVLQVLSIYLLVLVPLNWLVFWLIGRVEWAWAAAPVIALLGAFGVIRLAQLDIGFVRSRTEVAILETQADYPRAHITRYTNLYTSLTTNYELHFEDPSAQALPFSTNPTFVRQLGEFPQECSFRRDKDATLSGVEVKSNSTGTVHSEYMIPVGKGIQIIGDEVTGQKLKNGTEFTLKDVAVFRRGATTGEQRVATIKELRPGAIGPLTFEPEPEPVQQDSRPKASELGVTPPDEKPAPPPKNSSTIWDSSYVMSNVLPDDPAQSTLIRLYRLAELARSKLVLHKGDVRLIAWTEDAPAGMTIYPAASQNRTRTLVLSHLVRGPLPSPKPDLNVYRDFRDESILFDTPAEPPQMTP